MLLDIQYTITIRAPVGGNNDENDNDNNDNNDNDNHDNDKIIRRMIIMTMITMTMITIMMMTLTRPRSRGARVWTVRARVMFMFPPALWHRELL